MSMIDDETEVKRSLLQKLIDEMTKGQHHDIQLAQGHSTAPMELEEQYGQEVHDMAKPVDHSEQGFPEGPKVMERMDSPQLKDAMSEGSKKAGESGDLAKALSDESPMESVDEDDNNQKKSTAGPKGSKFKLRNAW